VYTKHGPFIFFPFLWKFVTNFGGWFFFLWKISIYHWLATLDACVLAIPYSLVSYIFQWSYSSLAYLNSLLSGTFLKCGYSIFSKYSFSIKLFSSVNELKNTFNMYHVHRLSRFNYVQLVFQKSTHLGTNTQTDWFLRNEIFFSAKQWDCHLYRTPWQEKQSFWKNKKLESSVEMINYRRPRWEL